MNSDLELNTYMYLERLYGGPSILEVRFLPTCFVLLYFDNDTTVIHS